MRYQFNCKIAKYGKIVSNHLYFIGISLYEEKEIKWQSFNGFLDICLRHVVVQENLKFVDFVTSFSRCMFALVQSKDPMLTKIIGDKPRLLILNKADLCRPSIDKRMASVLDPKEFKHPAINSKEQQITVKVVTDAAKKLMADKIALSEGMWDSNQTCVP